MILIFFLLALVSIVGFYAYQHAARYYRKEKNMKWLTHIPGYPIIGNVLEFGDNNRILNDFQRLIIQYGKLLYLNFFMESTILATDYDFVEFILSKQDVLSKSSDYLFLHKWLGTGLLTSDGLKWQKRRKMLTPAFHFSILEQFIEVFEKNLEILISKLENEVGNDSTDIYPFINLYGLDVICETAMGVSVNAQKDNKSSYVRNVKDICALFLSRSFSPLKKSEILYRLFPDFYKEVRIINSLHAVTNSVIDTRRKELDMKELGIADEGDDVGRKKKIAFLDLLLRSTIDGKPLSTEDIREEVNTFMFEGHDTVTSAISFTLHLLAMHPKIQARVLEEQKDIFHDNITRSSTYKDLQEMRYLELVIKESMRLYPPVPFFGRSTTQEVYYKGNRIPEGVNIAILAFNIHRDPDYFDEPEKFNPDRFEQIDGTKPYTYIPFSAGSRNCIGQKFAMLEVKSTLSKILRRFDLRPSSVEHKMVLVAEATLKSKNGLKIKLENRKF